jgi:hypothetical protein
VYHLATASVESDAKDELLETLAVRVERLERLLANEAAANSRLRLRISALEEQCDKNKHQVGVEVKAAYRGMELLWRHFGLLEKRLHGQDDRIDALCDANHAMSDDICALQARVVTIDDASMRLEERMDNLDLRRHTPSPSSAIGVAEKCALPIAPCLQLPAGAGTEAWTVHISLMPTASQPFPFEKDTVAYKRVLSRGLHRVIAIPRRDSRSFVETTTAGFSALLKGRKWMPLVAKICDAQRLKGLPMLRQLDDSLVNEDLYDSEFLKRHCATLDAAGNILDLYIAMCDTSFSWSELRDLPPFLNGLESCWEFDAVLDVLPEDSERATAGVPEPVKDYQQVAGNLVGTWLPATTLKRSSQRSLRTASFSSTEGVTKRSKLEQRRTDFVERSERRAEIV